MDVDSAREAGLKLQLPAHYYMTYDAFKISNSIDQLDGVIWYLALSLLLAWIICFICLSRGIRLSGKVVYFTCLFPYAVLIILFIRGLLLENYHKGIMYYITPNWSALAEAKVWKNAATQVFFSLSTCWGGLITLSSYNRFHNNALKDALIVCLGDTATSIFAGFVVFSYLGFMAGALQDEIGNVVTQSVGLAFVVYPTAVTLMPAAPLWAILFFFMLVLLGMDSQFVTIETIHTSLCDQWPDVFGKRKLWLLGGICVFMYIIGLFMCTHAGVHILRMFDEYSASWQVLVIAILECIGVVWIYGFKRLSCDLRIMLGFQPFTKFWVVLWAFVTPAACIFVLVYSLSEWTFDDDLSPWANGLGFTLTIFSVTIIAVVGIYECIRHPRVSYLLRPTPDWGPLLLKHRRLVSCYVPNFIEDPHSNPQPDLPMTGVVNPDPAASQD